MPLIPLGIGAYSRASAFTPEVELVNMYLEEDKSGASPDNMMRIQRPGLNQFTGLPEAARAIFQQDGALSGAGFAVVHDQLWSFSSGALGFVGASGNAAMAATQYGLFIVSDFKLWLWDGSTLTNIPIPDGYLAVDLDTIDGFVIIACSSGRFYWVQPGATALDPLDFATAESSPDGLLACCRVASEMWFFGGTSVEPWQPTGDGDAPFQRASGRVYARGCASTGSVRRFDNSVVWVGEDGVVYRGDATPTRISDHGVEERIRRALPQNTVAMGFEVDGHKFYVLRIGETATMAFDASTQQWCSFKTPGVEYWRVKLSPPDNSFYLADGTAGNVFSIDPNAATDAGEAFPRVATATVPIFGRPPRNDSLSIGMSASDDCTVKVRWKDGQDDYPAFYEELDMRAPLDVVSLYRLGMPDQPYRTVEIRVDDPVQIRIAGAVANQSWQ